MTWGLINFLMIFTLVSALAWLTGIAFRPGWYVDLEGWAVLARRWWAERRRI